MSFPRKNLYSVVQGSNYGELDLYSECAKDYKTAWVIEAYYTINDSDIARPDRIATKVWDGSGIMMWWIILIANNILDPFNDLQAGMVLKIPSEQSCRDFYNFVNNQRKTLGYSTTPNIRNSNGWMAL